MIFKIENSTFTIEEILYHISKGKSHLSPLVIARLNELQERAEKAEKELAILTAKE